MSAVVMGVWCLIHLTHLLLLNRGSGAPDRRGTMVTSINIFLNWVLHGQSHKICIHCILNTVPVDGDARHIQCYQIWEGSTLYKGEASTTRERLYGHLGIEYLSRLDASFCNSYTDLVANKIILCSTKSVSAKFFLYHLHIHCLKATIPYTP